MKKRIILLLIIFLALSGCESKNESFIEDFIIQTKTPPTETTSNAIADIITSQADVYDVEWAKSEFEKSYFEADIIYPINHVIMGYTFHGTCAFVLHGFYGAELGESADSYLRSECMINSIEIRALDGSFYQLIDGLYTNIDMRYYNDYGFYLEDWNADGNIDIRLYAFLGGTMHNEPSYFWLWDNELKEFVENEELNEMSLMAAISLEENSKRIRSYTRLGGNEYALQYLEYINEEFITVESEEVYLETENGKLYQTTVVSKLIDGELKIVDETRVELNE